MNNRDLHIFKGTVDVELTSDRISKLASLLSAALRIYLKVKYQGGLCKPNQIPEMR